MAYKKEEILKDWRKVNDTIKSCTKQSHILACLKMIILFIEKHPDYIQLSLRLQNKLDIIELKLSLQNA